MSSEPDGTRTGEVAPRTWRVLVAVGLAGVFGLSVLLTVNGGLQWDDFGNLRFSHETTVIDFLLRPVFDHFAPGHRALTLLQYELGPSNTEAMHLVMSGITTLLLAGFVAAARRLYGRRPWILALALLLVVSTPLLATQLWFAAALHQIPALAAGLWALVFFLRYRDGARGRDLFVSVLLVVLGLAFVSKTLLVVGVIYLVDQLLLRPGRIRDIPGRTIDEWPLWLAYVLPVAVYMLLTSDVLTPTTEVSAAGSVATGIRYGWLDRFLPLLVGWDPSSFGVGGAELLALLMALQVVVAGVAYVAARRRRSSLRAMAIVLAVVVVNGWMTLVLRIDAFGPGVPLTYRYWLEPLVFAALLLPWGFTGTADTDAPKALREPNRAWAIGAGTLVVAGIAFVSGWSAARMVDDHSAFRARSWLDDVQTAVASGDGRPSVLDDVAPLAWAPVWTLRDMGYLFPDARFTDDPDALMVRGDDLVEPDYQPFFELDGADLVVNTLTTIDGDVVADGSELCAADATRIEVFLAPAEARRFAVVHLRGQGSAWFVPIDEDGEELPRRELRTTGDGTTSFFPVDLWPPSVFGLQLEPDEGERLCLGRLSVGTVTNAPALP